jgi:hypothetical protein
VATSIAGGIHSAVFGTGPLFNVPPHDYAGLGVLPLYAVLGVASGLVAVVIVRGLFESERRFRSLRLPIFWHPLIGALVFASIGLFISRSLGVGYDVIDDIVIVPLAVGGDLTMARDRLELQLGLIEALGVSATGEIGGTDPIAAIEAALAPEAAVGVVLSTLPARSSRWHRSGVPSGIDRRINIPCVVVPNDEPKQT